jgi:mitogen-activated protein kinase kinase kinase 1
MEYMQNGNLSAYLESHTKLDWQIKARMIFEMTSGLAELHAKDIIHRDINGSNVLLDKDLHVKLTDFGFAKVKKDLRTFTKSKSKGHLALEKNSSAKLGWMAPEVFNVKADYSKASDVYSLGMTMWQIITQKAPFEDDPNPKAIDQRIIAGNVETIPADCPPKYSSLILYCWRKSAAERPTAQSMLEYLKSAQDSDTYLPNKAGVTAVATSATAAHTMVKK